MKRVDAIVIGAGPAGSTTAYRLARAGARVTMVDRARFPRDKPCGGGLTIRAVKELPIDPEPVVEHVVDRMSFRFRYRAPFERGTGRTLVLMTQRIRLDAYLAEQAVAAGAEFRQGVKVGEIEEQEDGFAVAVDGERLFATVLVGADGANGSTAKTLGLGGGYVYGVALEANAPYDDRYRERAVIELGSIPGGYGWVFPKGDHINVGVGGWEHQGPRLRDHLAVLCRQHAIDESALTGKRGHRLPLRGTRSQLARGRALLVGDAAGLVDPLSGDGMYEAFVSSRLGAQAILELLGGRTDRLDSYADEVTRTLGPMASASWTAKRALDRFPRLTYALMRAPFVWPVVEHVLSGEVRNLSVVRGAGRYPLKAIEALGRL